ncbi:MAG TPA: hypothetical protein VGK58_08510 [Lacipirellulaceae bacterium]
MQRAILILLSLGLVVSSVSAQPADELSAESGGEYGEYGVSPYGGGSYSGSPYGGGLYGGRARLVDPRQTQQLIKRWKASKEAAERQKIETQLTQMLKREFAARLAAHEREIKQLEDKVRQLRQRLTLRREKQDEIVDHRLQQILREAQGLGWGSEGAASESVVDVQTTTETPQPATSDPLGRTENTSAREPAAADDSFGDGVTDFIDPEPSRN